MKKKPKYVYVQSTNSIGVILETGKDPNDNTWFRTDSDGIVDTWECLYLYTKADVISCMKQLNAHISPSTKQLIKL